MRGVCWHPTIWFVRGLGTDHAGLVGSFKGHAIIESVCIHSDRRCSWVKFDRYDRWRQHTPGAGA